MSTLKVALIQTNIKWLDISANLAALEQQLSDCKAVDLILLPETFATGFAMARPAARVDSDGGQILIWLKAMAERHQAVIAGSVFVTHRDKIANRFYWVWPNGETKYYDKRHLFRLGNEGDHVIAGQAREVFNINGVRILPQVCYDLRFPVWARNQNDYDVLVNVANWPAARRKIWDTLLQARAIENQAYVLGVNRIGQDGFNVQHSGGTVAYDFKGDTLALVEDHCAGVLYSNLDLDALAEFKQQFPAYLDADSFSLLD